MTTIASVRPGTSAAAPARFATVGTRLAVTGLVAGAALNTAEAVLAQMLPARPEAVADQLRLAAEHSTLFGLRAVLGTLAVPLMALAFLAAAQHLASRARRTAWVAGSMLLAGMWGFLGLHVLILLQVPASTLADPSAAAAVFEAAERSPVLAALFLVPFLVGCVGGMVVLSLGLLLTGAVPRWIPACWLSFIALDFTVGAVGPVDPHWLFLLGALGFARHLVTRDRAVRAA